MSESVIPSSTVDEFKVLFAGYAPDPAPWEYGSVGLVASTVSFLRDGDRKIIVDPGFVPGQRAILDPLAELGYEAGDITDVIFSHWHPDHTYNAGLFPNAQAHDVWGVYKNDTWLFRYAEGYQVSPGVTLIQTPGPHGSGHHHARGNRRGPRRVHALLVDRRSPSGGVGARHRPPRLPGQPRPHPGAQPRAHRPRSRWCVPDRSGDPALSAGAGRLAIQVVGIGRMEAHPPGIVDGTRFEGRFVIYAMNGPDGPVFGADVPLFDDNAVATYGRGPQSAHLVCVRSGYVLEGFVTTSGDMPGHTVGRTSSSTRWKVYFDPTPDGTRSYDDRASFTSGQLVATYAAEEFFQIDGRAEVFDTRVNYSVLESVPFQFRGVTVDLGVIAPRLAELSHGHLPETNPNPEIIPTEEPFLNKGPGIFASHFPVGGTILAVE